MPRQQFCRFLLEFLGLLLRQLRRQLFQGQGGRGGVAERVGEKERESKMSEGMGEGITGASKTY